MGDPKHKVSISVDETTLLRVHEAIRTGRFRNRSHAFEHTLLAALEEKR